MTKLIKVDFGQMEGKGSSPITTLKSGSRSTQVMNTFGILNIYELNS